MATTYTFRFTDPSKAEFYVAAYTGDGWENPNSSSTLMLNADGNTATSANTTLKLYGKGMPEYGQGVMQDLIYVLENFANDEAPKGAVEGQQWYNNANGVLAVTHDGTTWDNLLLASGVVPMAADLDMGGNRITNMAAPSTGSDAVTLTYANTNYLNATGDNISGNLNFISAADLVMNSAGSQVQLADGTATDPALTFLSDTDNGMYYVGTNSFAFSTNATQRLLIEANGTLSVAGTANYETLVLSDDDIPNKKYVDDEITTATTGTSLTGVSFEPLVAGSPFPVNATDEVMVFEIGGVPSIYVYGLDYIGKIKPASEVSFSPTAGITSTDVQNAIVEVKSTQLDKTGDSMTGQLGMSGNRITSLGFPATDTDAANKAYVDDVLLNELSNRVFLTDGVTDTYDVFDHPADGNGLQLYLNGNKQYRDSSGFAELGYARTVATINASTLTYIDETVLDYAFDVVIDGGSPIAPITVFLPLVFAGSPAVPISTEDVSTHGLLLAAINNALNPFGVTLNISGINNTEEIKSDTFGAGSVVSITTPSGSPATYLFDIPATLSVTAINYTAGSPFGAGSPVTYDSFEVAGDQTASFPVGRKFTLLNTATDDLITTNIDGVYTVVSSTFGAATVIEVEEEIWQEGIVTTLGDISLTNVAGLITNTSTNGLDLNYQELDVDGNTANRGDNSTQIKFNTLPPADSVVEVIKMV